MFQSVQDARLDLVRAALSHPDDDEHANAGDSGGTVRPREDAALNLAAEIFTLARSSAPSSAPSSASTRRACERSRSPPRSPSRFEP